MKVMTMSKLRIVNRKERFVEADVNFVRTSFHLKHEPRCNAGDVQKTVNYHISQRRPQEAYDLLVSRTIKDGITRYD